MLDQIIYRYLRKYIYDKSSHDDYHNGLPLQKQFLASTWLFQRRNVYRCNFSGQELTIAMNVFTVGARASNLHFGLP